MLPLSKPGLYITEPDLSAAIANGRRTAGRPDGAVRHPVASGVPLLRLEGGKVVGGGDRFTVGRNQRRPQGASVQRKSDHPSSDLACLGAAVPSGIACLPTLRRTDCAARLVARVGSMAAMALVPMLSQADLGRPVVVNIAVARVDRSLSGFDSAKDPALDGLTSRC